MTSKQTTIALLKLEVENDNNALKLFDAVRDVIIKFDGKVANKRFDTALKAIDSRLSLRMQYNTIEINYWDFDNRMVRGDNGCYYIKYDTVHIAGGAQSSCYGDSILTDDNRIIAEHFLTTLDQCKESIIRTNAAIEQQLSNIDSLIAEHEAIKAQMKEYNDKVNHRIREYFDLTLKVY